jgi:hypothetical protein
MVISGLQPGVADVVIPPPPPDPPIASLTPRPPAGSERLPCSGRGRGSEAGVPTPSRPGRHGLLPMRRMTGMASKSGASLARAGT